MKEIKDDSNKWEDICSLFRTINITKMPMLSKANLQIQCNPNQNTHDIYHSVCMFSCFRHVQLCDPRDPLPVGTFLTNIFERVALPSSRRSSWTRDRICVSCIAGRFFTTEPPRKPIYPRTKTTHVMEMYPLFCNSFNRSKI